MSGEQRAGAAGGDKRPVARRVIEMLPAKRLFGLLCLIFIGTAGLFGGVVAGAAPGTTAEAAAAAESTIKSTAEAVVEGEIYSLTTLVGIDDLTALTRAGGVTLAGFQDEAGVPVLSVRWVMRGGMMPTWTLILQDHQGSFLKGGPNAEMSLAYTFGYPVAGHVYQTVINYQPENGALWISVIDTTEGHELCRQQLVAGTGVMPLRPFAEVGQGIGAVLSQVASGEWIPAGMAWELVSTALGWKRSTVGSQVINQHQFVVAADAGDHPYRGRFQLRFLSETTSGGEAFVPLRSTAGQLVPENPAELPLGENIVILEYVQDGRTWVLGRSNVKLVQAQVTAAVEVRERADSYIQGEAVLTSAAPAAGVAFEMLADIDVWRYTGKWEPVAKNVKVMTGEVTFARDEPVILPFRMGNPAAGAGEPGVYRINFRFAGIPENHYQWVLAEGDARWDDGKGNRYTGREVFVRSRNYGSAVPELFTDQAADLQAQLEKLREARAEAARRPRRIIFNNDGHDAVSHAISPTPQGMLSARSYPLIVSQVDAIFYSTWDVGLVNTIRRTEIGRTMTLKGDYFPNNITADLLAQGTDPLQVIVDFGKKHDIEIFWSLRMNDTHDASEEHQRQPTFAFKSEHPHYLLGSAEQPTLRGRWTGFNYGLPEVREIAFRLVEEVCQNYDIDGIELDFFRHLQYFKSVAYDMPVTEAELEMMTELVRRIRHMTEMEGLKRGRPILVAVRVPDSVEYARDIGLDIRTWLAEGLVDLLITGGYFNLNPWEYSVSLAKEYGVQVYASLDESRLPDTDRRNSIESYRAQAMNAWLAGVDGIYMFNIFNPRLPHFQEIGDPKLIAFRDKLYFANVRNRGGSGKTVEKPITWLKDGYAYQHMSRLSTYEPMTVTKSREGAVEIWIGDDFAAARAAGYRPQAVLEIQYKGRIEDAVIKVNGDRAALKSVSGDRAWFTLDPDMLRQGANLVTVAMAEVASAGSITVQDMVVAISYR
ncbi:MAG TPA: family 10 glycosylhydrolase [Firmicutes bacterium]|nr:family 10 glycosylhydrolase [Bacillota bacterium]